MNVATTPTTMPPKMKTGYFGALRTRTSSRVVEASGSGCWGLWGAVVTQPLSQDLPGSDAPDASDREASARSSSAPGDREVSTEVGAAARGRHEGSVERIGPGEPAVSQGDE